MQSAFGVEHGTDITKSFGKTATQLINGKGARKATQVSNQLARVQNTKGGTVPKQNLKGVQVSNWQRDLNKAGKEARRRANFDFTDSAPKV
jgi:hypothetical protein